MDDVRVCDEDVRKIFVKARLKSRRFCRSLYEYNGALNLRRARRTGECVLHEQSIYASRQSCTRKKLLNGFVLI